MRQWGPRPTLLVAWGRHNEAHNTMVLDAYDGVLSAPGASVACLDLLALSRGPSAGGPELGKSRLSEFGVGERGLWLGLAESDSVRHSGCGP